MKVGIDPCGCVSDLSIACCNREHLTRFSLRYYKYYSQII